MDTLTVYCFEDSEGVPDSYTTMDYDDADRHASRYQLLLIAREYEYSDTDYVADYRTREAQRARPVIGLSRVDDD